MKKTMGFAYRHATKTTLAYAVRNWLQNLKNSEVFEAVHFVGAVFTIAGAQPVHLQSFGEAIITHWCLKLRLPIAIGLIKKGDLLRYDSANHTIGFGFVIGFCRVRLSTTGDILFLAVIESCDPINPLRHGLQHWKKSCQQGILVSSQIRAAVPSATFGGPNDRSFVPSSHT
jgi:hypothetical protein